LNFSEQECRPQASEKCETLHFIKAAVSSLLPQHPPGIILQLSLGFCLLEAAMGKKALIVADMLNDFIDPKGSLYVGASGREIIPFVGRKIEETRRQGGVVIFVCDAHAPDDREFKYFGAHAVRGSWGGQVIPELPLEPGDLRVEKTRYSAFSSTNLDEVLKKEQVDRVEVVGVCTSICIMETVKELFDRDIPALVYRQGVADFDPEAHAFALKHLERIFGARVV